MNFIIYDQYFCGIAFDVHVLNTSGQIPVHISLSG